MSGLLYRYFLKKTDLSDLVKLGDEEDPYFEEIPPKELHFYQRKGAKRRRKLPTIIPQDDLKVLQKVQNRAYRLDLQLSIFGFRFGWAALIGLFPWIGTAFATYLAFEVVLKADEIRGGLPIVLKLRMTANVTIDFCIGLIPIVGDFINILYRCNSRNYILLKQHLVQKYTELEKQQAEVYPNVEADKRALPNDKPNTVAGSTSKPDVKPVAEPLSEPLSEQGATIRGTYIATEATVPAAGKQPKK